MSISLQRSEAEPERRIGQLGTQVRALEQQVHRLQRLATVGTMAEMVVHEFNNILTPLASYAQLAMAGDEPARDRAIRQARDRAVQAGEICDALLDLGRPDGEKLRTVSLHRLVGKTIKAMARDPAKDGIQLIVTVPTDLRLRVRPAELKQVLLNLLLNARQAVMERGAGRRIAVEAVRRNDDVLIRVKDSGVGIPPENLKLIFEPFFTTHDGDAGGTGLGLAVCRHIVQGHHGRLTVRSQQGQGTCFTVALPAGRKKRAPRGPARKAVAAG